MTHVLACIDGSIYSESVADHAAWAAGRLGKPVELLTVLGRREAAVASDRSGRIVAGARRKLLEELAELDAERSKLLQKEARLALDEAEERIGAAGVSDVHATLRRGDLLDTLHEREEKASMVIVGKRGEAADFATMHLGSNLERIARAVRRPLLIASRGFRPIERAVIAFDGRESAQKAVEAAATSPLYAGLDMLLLTAGEETRETRAALDRAAARLREAGGSVEARIVPGRPEAVIGETVEREKCGMLLMGAYGHNRLRHLLLGSATAELIRTCLVPVAIFR